MREARPGGAAGNEPQASKKKAHKQDSTPLDSRQVAPAAVTSLARLQRLRFDYDCWDAVGRSYPMPQPSDFALDLPDLEPHQVQWGSA